MEEMNMMKRDEKKEVIEEEMIEVMEENMEKEKED